MTLFERRTSADITCDTVIQTKPTQTNGGKRNILGRSRARTDCLNTVHAVASLKVLALRYNQF